MTTVSLTTTATQFEDVHTVLAKRRAGTKRVSVDADALAAILRDHSVLIAAIQDDPCSTVEEPE